jgi:hypothetical protein
MLEYWNIETKNKKPALIVSFLGFKIECLL